MTTGNSSYPGGGKLLSAAEIQAVAELLEEGWQEDEVPAGVLMQYVRDLVATIMANANPDTVDESAHGG